MILVWSTKDAISSHTTLYGPRLFHWTQPSHRIIQVNEFVCLVRTKNLFDGLIDPIIHHRAKNSKEWFWRHSILFPRCWCHATYRVTHTDAELNRDERPFCTKEMNKLPCKFQSRSTLFQIENKKTYTIRELPCHTRPFWHQQKPVKVRKHLAINARKAHRYIYSLE
mgnify:CR=1 FL=1